MLVAPPFDIELEQFRDTVRSAICSALPADIRNLVAREQMDLPKSMQCRWHRILRDLGGWCCPGWPAEFGGPGWSDTQQYIFEQELSLNDAPRLMIYGVGMLGPTLFRYGSEWQKQKFLPEILNGDVFWCQGYSEPSAGSDLAALQCQATRNGKEFVVNGSKIWTSEAHIADWLFGLFRTRSDGTRQQGITFLMIDLASPGITVQPLALFEGTHEVNQVYFENVKVPEQNMVGEQHHGWEVGKYLLGLERFGTAEVSRTKASLRRLKNIACAALDGGLRLIDDPVFADRLAEIEMELFALELTERRFLLAADADDQIGSKASLLKVRGTEIQNDVFRLTAQASGNFAAMDIGRNPTDKAAQSPYAPSDAARNYFNYRKTPIYSGTNEIQRTIVAKSVLRL